MSPDKPQGLLRFIGSPQREKIEREIGVTFEDLYNSIEDTRDNLRDLEKSLDQIFYYGEDRDEFDEYLKKQV